MQQTLDTEPATATQVPRRRPKSSVAQIVTAVMIAIVAAIAVALGGVTVAAIKALDHIGSSSTASAPSAVRQWLCLPYMDFVLDQHRAGLSSDQIRAVLEVSEYDRGSQPGVTQPVADITAPRLDSMEACGFPFEIIDAATPNP